MRRLAGLTSVDFDTRFPERAEVYFWINDEFYYGIYKNFESRIKHLVDYFVNGRKYIIVDFDEDTEEKIYNSLGFWKLTSIKAIELTI